MRFRWEKNGSIQQINGKKTFIMRLCIKKKIEEVRTK